METKIYSVALVDDHVLLRNGLANLVQTFGEYSVSFEADNGKDFISKIGTVATPDIVLIDINMPEMDGFETAAWIKRSYPHMKMLALSMYDAESSIIRMLRNGVKGYLLKDIDPPELKHALDSLIKKGFYYSESITGKLIHAVNHFNESDTPIHSLISLTEREIEFIKLCCTELAYKEIAEKMTLSVRTIDGYRDHIFEKLNVKTRVGLVLYAIKNGLVNL